jgi:D-ribose pyranase
MKKRGILNESLAGALAGLGHTDRVVVADCGLPRPIGVPVVDLSVTFGVPTFAQVIGALADEIEVESVTVAKESRATNPAMLDVIGRHFAAPTWVSHEELTAESALARLFIRTGEATPYANAILRCGVAF